MCKPIQLDLIARLLNDPGAIAAPGLTRRPPARPEARGYSITYTVGDAPDCPGCGRSHWLVGRQLAECAFCSTALPIVDQVRAA